MVQDVLHLNVLPHVLNKLYAFLIIVRPLGILTKVQRVVAQIQTPNIVVAVPDFLGDLCHLLGGEAAHAQVEDMYEFLILRAYNVAKGLNDLRVVLV